MPEATKASYCYQCGRRVSREQDHCWYCGVSTRRHIREPKRCPFCRETVQREAVKCRHCGEFIDGRPRPPEVPAGPSQIIYIIDKDLLRAARDFRLLAGQPVPPEVARALDAQTLRAIETNQPALIHTPGVRALLAPEAGADPADHEVIDVAADEVAPSSATPGGGKGRLLMSGATKDLAVTRDEARGAADLPARRDEALPPATVGSTALALGRSLGKGAGWLARRAIKKDAPTDDTIDAEVHDRYRICESCQTEVLAIDNYCYHCGFQFHLTKADVTLAARRDRRRLNLMLGRFSLALLIVCGVLKVLESKLPGQLPPAVISAMPVVLGVTALACLSSIFLGRGVMGKLWGIILTAILIYVAFGL